MARTHVKSGCRTCKARRVKCDESRPACLKCSRSGRICDGYGIWGGGSKIASTSETHSSIYWRAQTLSQYNVAVVLVQHSAEEKNAFDFFCRCPTLKISGTLKSEFWDRLLIQISTAEPIIFHALVAIASAHRAQRLTMHCSDDDDGPEREVSERLALKQYNTAIKELRRLLVKKDDHCLRTVAITCILFVCLEMIQGQQHMMESHYRFGLASLEKMESRCKQPIDNHIRDAFQKLDVHLTVLGQSPRSPLKTTPLPLNDLELIHNRFTDVQAAKESIEELVSLVLELKTQGEDLCPDTPIPTDLVKRQRALQRRMSSWKDAYHVSMKAELTTATPIQLLGLRVLLTYHTMVGIILATCLAPRRELAYDAFSDKFASIVSQIDDIMRICYVGDVLGSQPRLCDHKWAFSVEMGGLPPLYFAAIKCRVPTIRRKAINLLEKILHTEGMVNGQILSQIASYVFSLEDSKGFQATLEGLPEVDRPWSEEDVVPEKSRFYQVTPNLSLSRDHGRAELVCTRYHSDAVGDAKWECLYHQLDLKVKA